MVCVLYLFTVILRPYSAVIEVMSRISHFAFFKFRESKNFLNIQTFIEFLI